MDENGLDAASYSDVSLSMKMCAQRKAGRRQRARRRFACRLYPSHGPLRFITSHSRLALASTIRKTKRLRRRLALIATRRAEVTKYAEGKPVLDSDTDYSLLLFAVIATSSRVVKLVSAEKRAEQKKVPAL